MNRSSFATIADDLEAKIADGLSPAQVRELIEIVTAASLEAKKVKDYYLDVKTGTATFKDALSKAGPQIAVQTYTLEYLKGNL